MAKFSMKEPHDIPDIFYDEMSITFAWQSCYKDKTFY